MPRRLYNLDYLRGLSAFGIMTYHLSSWGLGPVPTRSFLGRFGVYGVSIFYVLSGLTLFFVYFEKMRPTLNELMDFFLKRFFRIFPLLWFATILTLLLTHNLPHLNLLLLNLSGLFAIIKPGDYFAAGVWSIGNELVFYLFFPLFVFLAKRSKPIFYVLCCAILAIYLDFAFFKLNPSVSHFQQWDIYINPLNQVFLFLAGFLLGYGFSKTNIPSLVSPIALLIGLLLFFLYPGSINITAGMDRVLFTAACILICFAFYKTTFRLSGLPDRMLGKLGEISYSVYLIHPIVWLGLQSLIASLPDSWHFKPGAIVLIGGSMLVTLIFSNYLYKYYELFFMNMGRKISKKTILGRVIPGLVLLLVLGQQVVGQQVVGQQVVGQQVVGQPAAAQAVGADSADAGPALQIHGFGPDLSITSRPVFHLDPAARSWLNIDVQPGPDPGQVRQAVFDLSYDSFKTRLFRDPRAGTFWIRFGVRNNSVITLPVDIYTATLNYTDCWWVGGGAVQHTSGGTLRSPLPGRSLIDRQYNILTLNIPPRGSGEIFLALRQKTSVFDFNGVHLFTPAALGSAFSTDYQDGYALLVFQWLFQGFLLCQILYMLFQWLIIRRKEYLYYLAYMAVIALYFLSKFESDLGLDLLFTRYPELKVYLSKTMLILPYFLYFRFVRHFLEIPENFPGLNKWIVRIEYFLLAYLVADLAFILLTFDQGLQTTVFTFILLLVFAAAASFIFYLFRRRQALIYYVLTGSLFVGIGNILGQVLTYFQDYHHLHLFTNILLFPQAGVLLEILCFTAGLGYKSHMWEKEKIRSQERLIEQLKANELLQSRMQHIRNKIAQDLHDDIGSTLSSISILSDLAMKENSSSQTMETMHEIKDSSILLMEKMDDIVWSINPRNDSLEHLLIRVRHFATTLFEAKDIDYRIEIQKNINEVLLPVDCRQHIYLILKESINNLVKYARATQATIEVQFDRQHLQLCVRDNGCGFNATEPSAGNGLSGMHRRAAMMNAQLRIKTAPGEGTEIGLQVEIG